MYRRYTITNEPTQRLSRKTHESNEKNEAILHQMVVEFNQSESLEQLETFEEDRMVIHNAIATMAASDPCAIVGEWVDRRW
jgi:hypothetical protein